EAPADDEAVADTAQADEETVAEPDRAPADSSSDAPQTAAGEDRFVPSVRISEDLSVSFPTDIYHPQAPLKQQGIFSDFIFQVFALIISLIMVHAVYVAVIRPNADAILAQQQVMQEADPDYVQEMSMYVVLRDFEQETCLILMFWAIAII